MSEVTVLLFKDGNQICALYGDNLMDGTAGFGATSAEALRDLAKELEDTDEDKEVDSCL